MFFCKSSLKKKVEELERDLDSICRHVHVRCDTHISYENIPVDVVVEAILKYLGLQVERGEKYTFTKKK